MDDLSQVFISPAFSLGITASALAMLLVVFTIRSPERLTPGGIVRGTQTFIRVAMAAYCAHKTPRHM